MEFLKKELKKKNHGQTTKFENTFALSLKAAHRNTPFPPPVSPAPDLIVVKGCFLILCNLCDCNCKCIHIQQMSPKPISDDCCIRLSW